MPLTQYLGDQLARKGFETSEQKTKRELGAQFERVAKGKFDRIPLGFGFKSELPGVNSIVVNTPTPPLCIYAHIRYRVDGKSRGETFVLRKDGSFYGRVPKTLADKVKKEDILREVLNRLERFEFADWIELEDEFFPPGEGPERGQGAGGGGERPRVPDPKRIELLLKQPDRQALFIGRRGGGFDGYRGFVFPTFVVLENQEVDNAVYFFDIQEFLVPRDLPREELRELLREQPWMETIRGSRGEAVKKGARRKTHAGKWEERVEEEIKRRLAAYNAQKKQEGSP